MKRHFYFLFAFFFLLGGLLIGCSGTAQDDISAKYVGEWKGPLNADDPQIIQLDSGGKGSVGYSDGTALYTFTWKVETEDGKDKILITNPENGKVLEAVVDEKNGHTVLFAASTAYYKSDEYDALQNKTDQDPADTSGLSDKTDADKDNTSDLSDKTDAGKDDTSNLSDKNSTDFKNDLAVTVYEEPSELFPRAYMVVKNTSAYPLHVSAAMTSYDAEGNLLGAKDNFTYVVGVGDEALLTFHFDEPFASVKYEITEASVATAFTPLLQNLTYESSKAKNKEVLSVTNNGDVEVSTLFAHCIFFQGDEVVGYTWASFDDLAPGKTAHKELSCYEEYDSRKFYFDAYTMKP